MNTIKLALFILIMTVIATGCANKIKFNKDGTPILDEGSIPANIPVIAGSVNVDELIAAISDTSAATIPNVDSEDPAKYVVLADVAEAQKQCLFALKSIPAVAEKLGMSTEDFNAKIEAREKVFFAEATDLFARGDVSLKVASEQDSALQTEIATKAVFGVLEGQLKQEELTAVQVADNEKLLADARATLMKKITDGDDVTPANAAKIAQAYKAEIADQLKAKDESKYAACADVYKDKVSTLAALAKLKEELGIAQVEKDLADTRAKYLTLLDQQGFNPDEATKLAQRYLEILKKLNEVTKNFDAKSPDYIKKLADIQTKLDACILKAKNPDCATAKEKYASVEAELQKYYDANVAETEKYVNDATEKYKYVQQLFKDGKCKQEDVDAVAKDLKGAQDKYTKLMTEYKAYAEKLNESTAEATYKKACNIADAPAASK
ncbi:MAG: hypothetical protein WCQ53_02145 [bacterium]